MKHIIDNDIKEKNEYQLTTALESLKNNGLRFRTGEIMEWLDCGNKDNILHSNARMLEIHRHSDLVSPHATVENSVIVPPCFIGDHAVVREGGVAAAARHALEALYPDATNAVPKPPAT